MKCPFCSAEIPDNALSCPSCQAYKSVQRTPIGVLTGWLGALSAILTAMIVAFIPLMLIIGINMKDFPWILPLTGVVMAIGFLGYSRTTRHFVWLQHSQGKSD